MKNRDKILIGVTSLAIVGLVLLAVNKKKRSIIIRENEKLDRIAEEGYEFAADVLYPLKHKSSDHYKSEYREVKSSAY